MFGWIAFGILVALIAALGVATVIYFIRNPPIR